MGASWPASVLQQGGFACAVGADEGQDLARLHPEANIREQRCLAVADGKLPRSAKCFFVHHAPSRSELRRTSSQMTTGAPNTAVTELMDSSVGANRLRASRSQNRQKAAPPRAAPRQHMQRLCAAQQLLDKVRHRDAYKGDRPRKGGDAGRQQAG